MLTRKAWSYCLLALMIVNGLSVGRVLWQESRDSPSDLDTLVRRVDQRLAALHDDSAGRVIGFPIAGSFTRSEREALRARAQYHLAPRLIVDSATLEVLLIDPFFTERAAGAPAANGPVLYRRPAQP